ncbi:MAG: glucose 1-dehydrogenase [Pseudomonadales bacterium]
MSTDSNSQGRLAGKVVLVTGAASVPGIGHSIAIRFAAEGAKLVVTDINAEGAEACAAEIIAAGGEAVAMQHDVANEQHWKNVIELTTGRFEQLDVMVNNAGIAELHFMADTTLENWQRHIDINLTGVFLGSKYSALAMRASGGGSIINMSSVAGMVGTPTCVAYGASKGGVRLMSKSIAVEEAQYHIRCNTIHPGFIWTNMQASDSGKSSAADLVLPRERVPLGRPGTPEEVANMALFLASDESSYVTGTEFVIDAGLTAH